MELTRDGAVLLRLVEPWLAKLDAGVRQVRSRNTPARVCGTTFASFASLWLLPRIEAFQKTHPDIDIRVSAHDALADLDDPRARHFAALLPPRRCAGRRRAPVRRGPQAGRQPRTCRAGGTRRGAADRVAGPFSYWLSVLPAASVRPEVLAFGAWLLVQAAATRTALGEEPGPATR